MKARCRAPLTFLFVSLISIAFQFPAVTAGVGAWSATTNYPISVAEQTCADYNGYVYCVGGFSVSGATNAVYFASLTNSGVGTWSSTTAYPLVIINSRCSAYNGYIYCVGGYDNVGPTGLTKAVYFASVDSSGVGTWTSSMEYPIPVDFSSCPISNGYIYCVGGTIGAALTGPDATNAVYFAAVSSTGVGTWTSTSSYPVALTKLYCSIYGGYIYCVGGVGPSGPTNAVYLAPVGSSGIGAWSSTTPYPAPLNRQSCVTSGESIYCVAGYVSGPSFFGASNAVYYATVTGSGVGAWASTPSYPLAVDEHDCVTNNDYLYCVGGYNEQHNDYTNAAYYTQLSVISPFDFSLSASRAITTIQQGGSGSNTITAALVSGSSQTVNLSCASGLPSGSTCSFNPASGSPTFTSTLSISTSPSTPVGSYTITVTGTGGAVSRTTQFTLTVQPALRITVSVSLLTCRTVTATVLLTLGSAVIATKTLSFTCSGIQKATFTGLSTGTYTATLNVPSQPAKSKTTTIPPSATMSFSFS